MDREDEPAVCPSCDHPHPTQYPYTETTACVFMVRDGFCGCTDTFHHR